MCIYISFSTGLIKKIDEISTLCGIEACAIIYNPNNPQPEVWPSELEAQSVLARFMTMPDVQQTNKMLDHEGFLKQRILKARDQLRKQKDDNKKKEMTNIMFQFMNTGQLVDNVSMNDLNSFSSWIDENLRKVDQKINSMQAQEVVGNVEAGATSTGGDQENMGHAQRLVIGGGENENIGHGHGSNTNVDVMQRDQHWSMDFTNNIDGVIPFGYVDVPIGIWHNPYLS